MATFAMMAWATWHEVCKRIHNENHHKKINIDWALSVLDNFDNSLSKIMRLSPSGLFPSVSDLHNKG